MALESEQRMLPIAFRPPQEVSWYQVEQVEKRRFLFWKKLVNRAVWEDPNNYKLARTSIKVEGINNLEDEDLRYALRFAAAADSIGWIRDSPESSYRHNVTVEAQGEGVTSRFASAFYTGTGEGVQDTFMADIRSFAVLSDEDH